MCSLGTQEALLIGASGLNKGLRFRILNPEFVDGILEISSARSPYLKRSEKSLLPLLPLFTNCFESHRLHE